MAMQATNSVANEGFGAKLKGYGVALLEAMMNNSRGAAGLRRVQALQAKSDEELASMGIKREDIVRHVFVI